jgi:hypothetical protein
VIHQASTFAELLQVRFYGHTNAACWRRTSTADYAEVVRQLGRGEGVEALSASRLRGLALSPVGRAAVEQMCADMDLLQNAGRDPVLNLIHAYPRDEEPGPIPTDVFSWHVDSAPFESDTWLCTYFGAASEALEPGDALRKVDDPAIRAQLLATHGGPDDADFAEWVSENHYDLHFTARPGAIPHAFGRFNLWRLNCAWPGSPAPGCVHRAPETNEPRLLLIC